MPISRSKIREAATAARDEGKTMGIGGGTLRFTAEGERAGRAFGTYTFNIGGASHAATGMAELTKIVQKLVGDAAQVAERLPKKAKKASRRQYAGLGPGLRPELMDRRARSRARKLRKAGVKKGPVLATALV